MRDCHKLYQKWFFSDLWKALLDKMSNVPLMLKSHKSCVEHCSRHPSELRFIVYVFGLCFFKNCAFKDSVQQIMKAWASWLIIEKISQIVAQLFSWTFRNKLIKIYCENLFLYCFVLIAFLKSSKEVTQKHISPLAILLFCFWVN